MASLGNCLLFVAILSIEIVLLIQEYGTVYLKFKSLS